MNLAKRKRSRQIVIRLSEEEYQNLKQKVAASGRTQAEYLIRCITGKTVTNTDGLKETAAEVKRVGVNLNQIAHTLNGSGYCDYSLITENQKELAEVWQLLRQSLRKLQ